ncbi:MAG: hypothetical protein WAV20_15700 [Blastocatellia bacterium]
MPHLPPIQVTGGSLKLEYPVSSKKPDGSGGKIHLKKDRTRDEVTDPGKPTEKRIKVDEFSEPDIDAKITLIVIKRADGTEEHRFEPPDGRCTVEIHYNLSDEPKHADVPRT